MVSAVDPTTVLLSRDEVLRYSRHLVLPEVGMAGQKKLKAARVLLIGAGGLGSPVSLYLTAAGVGTLGLVDYDVVDKTNLQRQVIHGTKDIGRSKLESAAETLRDVNPHVTIEQYNIPFTRENALTIAANYDIIVDGSDNLPTRYLINDVCVLLRKYYVYGSIYRFEGQISVFGDPEGPCYRCLFPRPPLPETVPGCAESGVLGILPGTIGTLQATEVIKLILGIGHPLIGRMLLYDALDMTWDTITLRKDPQCSVCGENPSLTELDDYEQFCGVPAHAHSAYDPHALKHPVPAISVQELKARWEKNQPFFLLDVREPYETEISSLGGALIPKDEVRQHLDEVPRDILVVVYCRTGTRSADVVRWLEEEGYTHAIYLEGGINAWAREIDPEMLIY